MACYANFYDEKMHIIRRANTKKEIFKHNNLNTECFYAEIYITRRTSVGYYTYYIYTTLDYI